MYGTYSTNRNLYNMLLLTTQMLPLTAHMLASLIICVAYVYVVRQSVNQYTFCTLTHSCMCLVHCTSKG